MTIRFNQLVKMIDKKENTEEKIINAARTVFVKKGMDGARMQEIADEAGINKALLHYYFRSKEKLFDAIFGQIIKMAFPKITSIVSSDVHFLTKLDQFLDTYLDVLLKHPYLPGFVLKEVNRDPSLFIKLIIKHGFSPKPVFGAIEVAIKRGEIIAINPMHLIANVIGMCVFPFAARPIIELAAFDNDKNAADKFFKERKAVIKEFVIRSLEVKSQCYMP